ncbi:P-loop NTPase fold protein [Gloeocapsopsis dulcis]|uniref:NTPase n=1 Tax=Gloeocapsopsis dulcis AAB1 = 1H9 TaxID=1433147 RepID=A0A6N8G466_9CHRO|nr:P-loop NTPase fold protein [Gloeocapsopsis dulcis]MUL39574.1 NTPase [Gloeocapsopsis dulcis AAB1 = 1H9]WNN92114.1 P-loop NTPase fold protein [Gloeocapsopsis dulcis]
MNQDQYTPNSHIEEYLDYYCKLSNPSFAILLKGRWGSGKTWFINRYYKRPGENIKYLYVSLYGMTNFSDIEYAFFQQLHPVLSHKGLGFAGKILKGLLKATVKIDLDDNKQGIASIQVPDIDLPEGLKNADDNILIFDDLERCKIDISNVLGYINYFVEQKGMNVIIIANEEELVNNSEDYKRIKEKLVGKTFCISLEFERALENFITIVSCSKVKESLFSNFESIQEIYIKTKHENLRTLKQIILDFERIYKDLPEEVKNKPDALKEILQLLIVFSIEIKTGRLLPKHISRLTEHYYPSSLRKKNTTNNDEELTKLYKMLDTYTLLPLTNPFPNSLWWEIFFDKGFIDKEKLNKSISNSKYFQNENTPVWVRMWRFLELSDDEFNEFLSQLEAEYNSREYSELEVIKHIFGIFLNISDLQLYQKTKEEILKEAKAYIDDLRERYSDEFIRSSIAESSLRSSVGLGFQGKDFQEFEELSIYIDNVQKMVIEEKMPAASQELLKIMETDVLKFYRMTCIDSRQEGGLLSCNYREVPIFKFIDPAIFVKTLLSMSPEHQNDAFGVFQERYKFAEINRDLIVETEWLESIRNLLRIEVDNRKGKLSGVRLNTFVNKTLDLIIKKLLHLTNSVEATN